MADTVEKSIYLALLERAQSFERPNGVDLAEPGYPYSPTAKSKFISVEIHFNRSIETDLSLQMDPIRQGFMRTNVMWPKGSAVVDAYNLAGAVREHLRRGTKLLKNSMQVRIDEDPEIGVLITGDTHHNIPITTRWLCYPQVPA